LEKRKEKLRGIYSGIQKETQKETGTDLLTAMVKHWERQMDLHLERQMGLYLGRYWEIWKEILMD
jgi:hypothetical protein